MIILTLRQNIVKITSEKKTYINFRKTDWDSFQAWTEDAFSQVANPSDIHCAEKIFRNIITKAIRFIPSGRILTIRPNFPSAAARLADQRDNLRAINPNDPEIRSLDIRINELVREHKQNTWREKIENSSNTANTNKLWTRLWRIIKNISNPQKATNNNAIYFNNTPKFVHHSTQDSKYMEIW